MNKSETVRAGLKGRCPDCGQGALFEGFLKIARQCAACGFDYSKNDVADGPAIFIIILASALVVPPAMVFQIKTNPPLWGTLVVFLPLITMVCMAMLRPFRGLLFAMQILNDAKPASLDLGDTEETSPSDEADRSDTPPS